MLGTEVVTLVFLLEILAGTLLALFIEFSALFLNGFLKLLRADVLV